MKEQIAIDTLGTIESVVLGNTQNADPVNWWFWIAVAEFILLVLLLLRSICSGNTQKEQSDKWQKFRKESLKADVDFDNIINSSFHAEDLYDRLKVKCHPDRFPIDKAKNKIAKNLFQEIEKNKNNINRLKELRQEAVDKLGVNI